MAEPPARPFDSLLIANRGEIACRIADTARRMGLRTIAVFSDADAGARHVRRCDEAVHIGPAAPGESYLDPARILAAARVAGAGAIHPGYGFLAENAGFAEACAAADIVFVGPPAAAMRAMGSKDAARMRMAAAGVPVTPGYDGNDQSETGFAAGATAIGFPLLVKATAGGGGRGIRLVESLQDLADALRQARAEAQAAFGDGRLLLERFVAGARHVEVQIVADRHGNVVHLHDRDCSIQRRRQKLVEEAPAPAIAAPVRAAMAEAAVTCARAVDYRGAGTVEFLLSPDNSFYFMEMNTRLQVEHPVTEAVTGIDLVAWQLTVAAGAPLPCRQHEIAVNGHAVEARVIAEDPARGFAPDPGPLALAAWPHGGVRVDTGYEAGDSVPGAYDSLLAKLVVHGLDRTDAWRGLASALRDTAVGPGASNLGLLAAIAGDPALRAGPVDIGWLERALPALLAGLPDRRADALALAAWHLLRPSSGDGDPWSRRDGWRVSGRGTAALTLAVDGAAAADLAVAYRPRGLALRGDGIDLDLREDRDDGGLLRLVCNGRAIAGHVLPHDNALAVLTGGARHVVSRPAPRAGSDAAAGDGRIRAPLPGRVQAVHVRPGAAVAAGAPLLALEAMKTLHALAADRDGVVETVGCAVGDQVARGDLLVVIAPASD
ncbi:MAG: biotin carboxylase N-terminal domain-containing protein [Alphaproteobacteria bacterium]